MGRSICPTPLANEPDGHYVARVPAGYSWSRITQDPQIGQEQVRDNLKRVHEISLLINSTRQRRQKSAQTTDRAAPRGRSMAHSLIWASKISAAFPPLQGRSKIVLPSGSRRRSSRFAVHLAESKEREAA